MARLIRPRTAILVAAAFPLVATSEPRAADDALDAPPVEVKRARIEESKHPTLTFLKENREFFRARLDLLRMTIGEATSGNARDMDPRWLALQSMLDDIRAAQDSAAAGEAWIRGRGLLESVSDLRELESQMDTMERLLAEQGDRLLWLEEDFVGRQETSLVVLLTGVPSAGAPAGVVLRDDDGTEHRIALGPDVAASLASGATAELLHELVEPRAQVMHVSFDGGAWTGHEPFPVEVDPARDATTFLELDLAGVRPADPAARLGARSWVR